MRVNAIQFGDQYEGEKLRRLMQEFQRAVQQLSGGLAAHVQRAPVPGSPSLVYWDGSEVIGLTLGSNLSVTAGVLNATGGGGGGGASSLEDLSDVDLTTPATNQVLAYDGTQWVNSSVVSALGLSDPGVDRLLFWDDSASSLQWLAIGAGLTLTGTTLTASASAPALNDVTDVTITGPSLGQFLRYSGTEWTNQTVALGETNTASNLGAGSQVFASKSGVDLRFRSLVAGTNITLTQAADTITIDAAGGGGGGEANTASNLGSGSQLFATKVGVDLRFRSLTAGSGIQLTQNANDVSIAATIDTLDELTDVVLVGSPSAGQVLVHNGLAWGNSELLGIGDLVDPNADRILFWDDSASSLQWLTLGTNLSITGTTINASGGGGGGYPPQLGHAGL